MGSMLIAVSLIGGSGDIVASFFILVQKIRHCGGECDRGTTGTELLCASARVHCSVFVCLDYYYYRQIIKESEMARQIRAI